MLKRAAKRAAERAIFAQTSFFLFFSFLAAVRELYEEASGVRGARRGLQEVAKTLGWAEIRARLTLTTEASLTAPTPASSTTSSVRHTADGQDALDENAFESGASE